MPKRPEDQYNPLTNVKSCNHGHYLTFQNQCKLDNGPKPKPCTSKPNTSRNVITNRCKLRKNFNDQELKVYNKLYRAECPDGTIFDSVSGNCIPIRDGNQPRRAQSRQNGSRNNNRGRNSRGGSRGGSRGRNNRGGSRGNKMHHNEQRSRPRSQSKRLKPCEEGKARHPTTNRCRKIENFTQTSIREYNENHPNSPIAVRNKSRSRSNLHIPYRNRNREERKEEKKEENGDIGGDEYLHNSEIKNQQQQQQRYLQLLKQQQQRQKEEEDLINDSEEYEQEKKQEKKQRKIEQEEAQRYLDEKASELEKWEKELKQRQQEREDEEDLINDLEEYEQENKQEKKQRKIEQEEAQRYIDEETSESEEWKKELENEIKRQQQQEQEDLEDINILNQAEANYNEIQKKLLAKEQEKEDQKKHQNDDKKETLVERKIVNLILDGEEDHKEKVNELLTKYLKIHTFFDTTARVKFHEIILNYFLNNRRSRKENNITRFINLLNKINLKNFNTLSGSIFLTAEVDTSMIIKKTRGKKSDPDQIYWEYLNNNPLPVFIKINEKRIDNDVFKNIELRVYKEYINKMIIDRLTPNLMMYQEAFEIKDWKTIYKNITEDKNIMTNLTHSHKELISNINDLLTIKNRVSVDLDGQVLILECANGISFETYLKNYFKILDVDKNKEFHDLNKELIQMFFQIFYTINVFTSHDVTHYDLHLGNIFLEDISKLPDKKNKFIYFINETEYVIIHLNNYLVKIFDWDYAYIDGMTDSEQKSRKYFCDHYGICNNLNIYFDLFKVMILTMEEIKDVKAWDIGIFKNLVENVFKKFVKNNSESPIENPIMRAYLNNNELQGSFRRDNLCNLKQDRNTKKYSCESSFKNDNNTFHEPHVLLNLLINTFPNYLSKKSINEFDENYYPDTHNWNNYVFGINKKVLGNVKTNLLRKRYQKVDFDYLDIDQKMYNYLISSSSSSSSSKNNNTMDEKEFEMISNDTDIAMFSKSKKTFYNINLLEAENIILSDGSVHAHNFYFMIVKLFSAQVNMNVFYMDQTIQKNPMVVCVIENLADLNLPTVYDHKSLFKDFKNQFSDETFKKTINKEYKLNIKFMKASIFKPNTLQISYSFTSPTLHVLAPLEYICKKMSERYREVTLDNTNKNLLEKYKENSINSWNYEEIPNINDIKYIQDITNSLEISRYWKLFVLKLPNKTAFDLFMTYVYLKRSSTEITVKATIYSFDINIIREKKNIEKVKKILESLYYPKKVTVKATNSTKTRKNNGINIEYNTNKDWNLGLQYTMDLLASMIEKK